MFTILHVQNILQYLTQDNILQFTFNTHVVAIKITNMLVFWFIYIFILKDAIILVFGFRNLNFGVIKFITKLKDCLFLKLLKFFYNIV